MSKKEYKMTENTEQTEKKAGILTRIKTFILAILFQRETTEKLNTLIQGQQETITHVDAMSSELMGKSQKGCLLLNRSLRVTNIGAVRNFHFEVLNNRAEYSIRIELHADHRLQDVFEIDLKASRSYEEFREAFELGEKILRETELLAGKTPQMSKRSKEFVQEFTYKFTYRFMIVASHEPVISFQHLFNIVAEAYKDLCIDLLKKEKAGPIPLTGENGIGEMLHEVA